MGLLVAFLAMGLVGVFFALAVAGRGGDIRYKYSVPEFFGLSFFLGMGFVTVQLFIFFIFKVYWSAWNLAALPILCSLLLFSKFSAHPAEIKAYFVNNGPSAKASLTKKMLIAGLAAQFAWIIFVSLPVPVNSHDAVANYAMKAKMFFLAGGIPDGFFSWPETVVAHPDYPPLLPFVMTWIYKFMGFGDVAVACLMPVVYVAFLCLFYSQVRKLTGHDEYSLIAAFMLGTIPQLAAYATIIHTDLILTAFITSAVGYLLLYLKRLDKAYLILSSFLFGFSFWIKNEAIVYNIAFFSVLLLFAARGGTGNKGKMMRDIFSAFIIVAVMSSPWFFVKLFSAAANSDIDIAKLTIEKLMRNVKDIPVILYIFQQQVFGPKKWNLFWILFFGAVIWKRQVLFDKEIWYITFFILISAAGYFAAYMLVSGYDLYFYVSTTMSRFMLHFSGSACVLAAMLLKEKETTSA